MASFGPARVGKDPTILVPIRGSFLKGLNIILGSPETYIPEVDTPLNGPRIHSKLLWAPLRGPYLQPRLFWGLELRLPTTAPSRRQESTDAMGIKSVKKIHEP